MRTLSKPIGAILVLLSIFLFSRPAEAKYGGGSGTADDPYQIAAAEDLIALGETPEDYDKHFILTADIDLGGHVFDKAVIAPDTDPTTEWVFEGTSFTGAFDGADHTISHLRITGAGFLGLFGQLDSWDTPPAGEVKDLGVVDVNITGSGLYVGGLAGSGGGITNSYANGSVSGGDYVGGLVGNKVYGNVTRCYSTGAVSGRNYVGGLIGGNGDTVTECHSSAVVDGNDCVGGLVGYNGPWDVDLPDGSVCQCCSTGAVTGSEAVGGLVGYNQNNRMGYGEVTGCYSTGMVSGQNYVGGLIGRWSGHVTYCFWDTQASGQATSAGGTGKTTAEMQTGATFWQWGACSEGVWTIDEGKDYPRFCWENATGEPIARAYYYGGGSGTQGGPYLIYTPEQLNMIGLIVCDCDKHFKLMADIDMSGFDGKDGRPAFNIIGASYDNAFTGVFDGNGHKISHVTIDGVSYLGLFGQLASGAEVKNLGVVDVNVTGSGNYVGGLVGSGGGITNCYATGSVSGGDYVGGLVGSNWEGTVADCYSTCAVSGDDSVGGLVGSSSGAVTHCYSTGAVSGTGQYVGGLVGGRAGRVLHAVWDIQTSGLLRSAGGLGLTTPEMMDPYILALSGFANDPNWVLDVGRDYPRLVWQGTPGEIIPEPEIDWLEGGGTAEKPYRIDTADQLILLGKWSIFWDRHLVLGEDIDLNPNLPDRQVFRQAVIPILTGVFDGNGHTISHVTITGESYLGLFGEFASGAEVKDLGVVDVNITGSGDYVGGLVGYGYGGSITRSYATGSVSGNDYVGGLAGSGSEITDCHAANSVSGSNYVGGLVGSTWQGGNIRMSHSSGMVSGGRAVGGLVGSSYSSISTSHSTSTVSGTGWSVGGLVGYNSGSVATSYSTGSVSGMYVVGGLVGDNAGTVTYSYSIGAVTGTWWEAGGLVGSNTGTVTHCCSTGAVSGGLDLGGLVGYSGGSVTQCYSTASVSGSVYVGGLVGYNSSAMTHCYSMGAVSGSLYVGGLVGYNRGTVTNCYSTGALGSGDRAGGLVGDGDANGVVASFWGIETSGQGMSAGGTGKTTAEMKTVSTFLGAGWDFVGESTNGMQDIWAICEGVDYPHLTWEFVVGDFDADADTDFADFCILAEHWLAADGSFWCGQGCDLTNDGSVNRQDLMVLAENWLAEGR